MLETIKKDAIINRNLGRVNITRFCGSFFLLKLDILFFFIQIAKCEIINTYINIYRKVKSLFTNHTISESLT